MKSVGEILSNSLLNRNIDQLDGSQEQLKEVCAEFEAILLGQMLRCMRSTVPDGGLLEKSSAREIFEGLLDENIAQEIAKSRTLGLADIVLHDLGINEPQETETDE